MKKTLIILSILILVSTVFYWFLTRSSPTPPTNTEDPSEDSIFDPFRRGSVRPSAAPLSGDEDSGITQQPGEIHTKLPRLRQITTNPVGGFMASSTASTTLVRYIDRGVGHIFEARADQIQVEKLTNTTIPRVYDSYWNRNASALVLRYTKDIEGTVTTFFADIRSIPRNASSTNTGELTYEVKGKFLTPTIQEIAVSPKGDRVFLWSVENGTGVGYISDFDESKKIKIFEAPLTQVNIDWPEENTLTLAPKASSVSSGSFYVVNIKTPMLQKLIPTATGLVAKMSSDAKKIIYSHTGPRGYKTFLYDTKTNTTENAIFDTPIEKCVWSKRHTNEIYCAVPNQVAAGNYPDDWYRGNVSFTDQIWWLDTETGDVRLIANPLMTADQIMDITDLALDPKDNFLYFVNRRDLTLWSLDLNE